MKKTRLLAAVCMALLCCLLLAGCGKTEVKVDINKLAQELVNGIAYDDTLELLETDEIGFYLTVEEGVAAVMYMSSGSTAEEVAVFEAPDETTAIAMKGNVAEFLKDQGDSFKAYIPEEYDRVNNAVVVQQGNYVALCVSGDSNKAQEIIDKAFAGK